MELLKEKLKLHMHVHGCTIFMQDGAPCHRSKVVTEVLNNNNNNNNKNPPKQNNEICDRMTHEQPISLSIRENVDYDEG